jgi:putative Mn2+ efflux pump MntP
VVAKLVALIVPLGLDTFAVAAALGMAGIGSPQGRRLPLLFSAFEAGMPLVGLALGAPLGHAIGAAADYIAIAVLAGVGFYTLSGSERREQANSAELARLGGLSSLALGVSISLDELAIGFTLGLLRLPAGLVIVLIALQAFALTHLGLRVGARLGARLREAAERLAGFALTGLAVALLVEKLVS